MADVKTAVVRQALPSSTGNFTVSIPGATWTPKAVLVFVSNANSGSRSHAVLSIGMCDGSNERAVHVDSRDNLSTSDTARSLHDDLLVYIQIGGTIHLEVTAVGTGLGPGSGQWVFNASTASTSINRIATFIFFGGDDLQAKVDSVLGAELEDDSVTETVGFDPDLVFFLNARQASPGYSTTATISLGAACNNSGTITQACAMYYNRTPSSGSRPITGIFNNRAICSKLLFNLIPDHTTEVTAFPTNGFTLTTRDVLDVFPIGPQPGDYSFPYLALDVGGDAAVKTWTWPDSTEDNVDYSISGTGFAPSLGVTVTPLVPDTNSFNTLLGANSAMSVSAFDADGGSNSVGISSDLAGTTNENSFESSKPLYTVKAGNSASVTADSVTFDADGVTFPASGLNSTATNGTYAWGFFIGGADNLAPVYLYHHRHHNRSA